ncbi:4Fe-4S binding protein [Paracoccus xiamenensis]|uniref:4Fe-4S binding protein n=1 Tax=Paracoccus xiamenensis TaxID=2714901 RepID=UPI001407BE69|nr:4Fe-4S binding protein [Paracoccus xiamenensis]NHF74481.1 4Fe-4S binding protein [Paracoccus xiamenensis]
MGRLTAAFALAFYLLTGMSAQAEILPAEDIAARIDPPYFLGDEIAPGIWQLTGLDKVRAGTVIQSEALAPLPGFSGAAINTLIVMGNDGTFLQVELLDHNEPIFVSGLGQAPFDDFIAQYVGRSVTDRFSIGTPAPGVQELDGVAKATASVRIAHESILAAALEVARDSISGLDRPPAASPDPDYREQLSWQDLLDQGLVGRLRVTNAEIDAAFAGTVWANDDPEASADPEGIYLDLYLVDLGPPSIAAAVLSDEGQARLDAFREISPDAEPLLLIDAGRHGLVGEDFVRNTAPALIGLMQDGFPLELRDSDLLFTLKPDLPQGAAMILRTDRRLGFDPAREYQLTVLAEREHGVFQPETGTQELRLSHATDARFFLRPVEAVKMSPLQATLLARWPDLVALAAFCGLTLTLLLRQSATAGSRHFGAIRLAVLAVTLVFVGWWGQGQLSVVTVTGTLRAGLQGQSLGFLLYDPFSLMLWGVALASVLVWGRGWFCGWMCPFGALQELTHAAGRRLGLRPLVVPDRLDRQLRRIKYLVLALLVVSAFAAPGLSDSLNEVEPFKTAVTTYFLRDWFYVAYALFWIVAGLFLFKSFCRYVCPLGAFFALTDGLRFADNIPRRAECGSPCQLCRVRCKYGAIRKSGEISYDECFQCLECVQIHDDATTCVPLVLAARKGARKVAA